MGSATRYKDLSASGQGSFWADWVQCCGEKETEARLSPSPPGGRKVETACVGVGGHPISFQSFGQLSCFFFGSLEKGKQFAKPGGSLR